MFDMDFNTYRHYTYSPTQVIQPDSEYPADALRTLLHW